MLKRKNTILFISLSPHAPEGVFFSEEKEEPKSMKNQLRCYCAILFALLSIFFASALSAQSQTREAYVVQSEDKTTLTFYYDAQRNSHTGKTWNIGEHLTDEFGDSPPAWAGNHAQADKTTRAIFDSSFQDFRPTTTKRWFYNCRVLTQIEGLEYLNTEHVIDMSEMFYGCSRLISLDLSRFNTQNVTNMAAMFSGCNGLTSIELSKFNTQNVTSMAAMFSGCNDLSTINLSNFDTQNVTDMSRMFYDCSHLTSLDLSKFNTQKVTNMSQMFQYCLGLTILDLQSFNTQNVTNMESMFSRCSRLTSLDLRNFNTQKVTNIYV